MEMGKETFLRKCHLFSSVESESLKRLVEMAVVKRYRKGRQIFREGEPAPGIFVVVSGTVRLYKLAPSGKDHVLHLAGPEESFAEVAVIGEFPCPAYAQALEACTCVLLPTVPFLRALRQSHDMCLQMMAGMTARFRGLVGLAEGIVLRDAAGRVARYLIGAAGGDPEPVVRLPGRKRDIASHLNMTGESFSRTLRLLREEELIEESEDGGLLILDLEGLRAVADGLFPHI